MRYFALLIGCWLLLAGGLAPANEGPGVIVAEAQERQLADRTEALGTLRANESIIITAKVAETISAIHFDDNQRVEAGDLLVEMTDAEERARFTEASARLAEAEQQFARVRALAAGGSAAASLLDERRRDLETARAALVAIESRLADRLLKAPFPGVIGLRQVSVGALVMPGERITTLDDDRLMKLDFAVPSVYLMTLHPGLVIESTARAFGERVFHGVIQAIDSRVDPVTRSVQVRALLPNPDYLLRPGLLMQVDLLRNPRHAVTVPEAALLHRGREHAVFVVDDASPPRVERRAVRIGAREAGWVEIRDGLAAGERVVTHGQDKLRAGQSVKVLAVDDGSRTLAELLGVTN